jgi:hypothetical protein
MVGLLSEAEYETISPLISRKKRKDSFRGLWQKSFGYKYWGNSSVIPQLWGIRIMFQLL